MKARNLIPLLVAALAAVVAGVAYAAIPAANGVISACKDPKGTLKVIDAEAGQTCAGNQQPLSWNKQGPPGPAGPAGSARAYAFVEPYTQTIIGVSRAHGITEANVALTLDGNGVCFGGLGFSPDNVTATLRFWNAAPAVVSAAVEGHELCPTGFDQAYVAAQLAGNGAHTLRPFYVMFN